MSALSENGSVVIKIKGDDGDFKSTLKNLGGAAANIMKVAAASIAAASAATVALGKAAVDAYADYEQLIGGVETLFKESADIVEGYANRAYKTAGLSANAYMETVTSFSASLLQSLGGDTEAAAKVADMAITDMADNANKMGTAMESIQNAYQGFAKQNYTMLDNLKLGYGGTKEEMQRLLKDAQALSGIKYEISNLNDVYEAIHVIQNEIGITGTTAKEASSTIQGSVAAMKSAWANMLVGIADDTQDFDGLLNNLIESVGIAAENILPRIQVILSGIAKLVAELLPQIASQLPSIARELLPQLVDMGISAIDSVVTGIQENGDALIDGALSVVGTFVKGMVRLLPSVAATATDLVKSLASGLSESLPELVPAAVETIASLVETLSENADQIISAGIDILIALGKGIVNAIPTLIEKIPQIVINIADVINNNAEKLFNAGLSLIVQLGIGLIKAIPTLIKNIPAIIEAIVKAFLAFQWINLGKSIITGIKNGIKNMGGSMSNAAKETFAKFKSKFSEFTTELKNIGKYIVDGIVEGIKKGFKNIGDAAKELGKTALSKVKETLGIHSPSAVMRDEVGAMLPLGMAKGIEQTTDKAVTAAKKMGKATFDAAKEWIDEKKYYNELSLEEELTAWSQVQRQFIYGSEEQKKANRELYRVQGELEKQAFENSKNWIEKKKFYNELSLADELKAWKRVQDRYLEGTEERIEAERKVFEVKSQINDELERLENNYSDALKNRSTEIFNSFQLFDSVKEKNEVSGQELMDNLENQISAMESFYGNLEELSKRGVSSDLVENIREMGVGASGELEALLSLSSSQLEEYSNLFGEKQRLANELAAEELTGLRKETDAQIRELLNGVENEFDRTPDLGLNMSKGLADGILDGMSGVIDAAVKVARAAIKAAKEELDINSPSRVMRDEVGKMIPQGIAVGIDAEMPTVEQRMTKAYHAMRESFAVGAHSLYTGATARSVVASASVVNNTENKGGDFILKVEKMVNDGKGSVSSLLQEAEFYRKQKVSATGGV